MKDVLKKALCFLVLMALCFSCQVFPASSGGTAEAAQSSARIHYLTLPGNTEAILLECNGQFGMVDSGEDNDYPDGSDPRYPLRSGVIIGQGYEDRVISYMRSVGVTTENFEFYIGTHPHSDHIGSADEVIRTFHPKRVYIQEYKDSYVSGNLWDNLYVYDHMIQAAQEVGATLIQNFDPSAPLYPEKVTVQGSIAWEDGNDADQIRPSQVTVELANPLTGTVTSQTVQPDSSGNWLYSFKDLQKYDDSKTEIAYAVSVQAPEGYTVSTENSFDFVCTHTVSSDPEDISVIWNDQSAPDTARPESLTVLLQRQSGENIWEDVQEFTLMPDENGVWSYSRETLLTEAAAAGGSAAPGDTAEEPSAQDSAEDQSLQEAGSDYRLWIPQAPADYTWETPEENPWTLVLTYTGQEEAAETDSGIIDTPQADAGSEGVSDNMTTSDIPAADQVDPDSEKDPTNTGEPQGGSARVGKFDTLSQARNTTSTPSFTLGGAMQIDIVHYGGNYKTTPKPDANYFCLGVKVTANGKSAFLAGDINNYEGAETALASQLGHVDILTLGHHGYYGSNTYGYVSGLSPKIMVMCGDYTAVSNDAAPGGGRGTLDTLLAMADKGSALYATAWYSDIVPALVFQLNASLTSNIPSGHGFVASASHADPAEHIYYRDGYPTAYNGWLKSGSTYYHFSNSSRADRNKWIKDSSGRYCYLDSSGGMVTGWKKISGTWYYFDASGYMATGWVSYNKGWYYLNSDGSMATGQKKINGATYYFDSNGLMITSAWAGGDYYGSDGKLIANYKNENWRKDGKGWWYQRPNGTYPRSQWERIDGDWYYFNSSGYMMTGWLKLGSTWYYLDSNGRMTVGWQKVKGIWYYMDASGAMLTGWQKVGGIWYYLDSSGHMLTGWQYLGGTWYYLNSSGQMLTGWQKVNGVWYYMDPSGAMLTGWQYLGGVWYYLNSSGRMLTGWQYLGGHWYYMDPSGHMLTGWQKVNGAWYYLNSSGHMLTGWQYLGGIWFYMNNSGRMLTGWQYLGGHWYYMDPSGQMLTGWQKLNGHWFYLNSSGHMLTGWQKLNGHWFYLNGSGHMLTGWQYLGGHWFYMNSSGYMLTGWQEIDGHWYYMNHSGYMLTGWQYLGGHWFYMDSSGHMLTGWQKLGNTWYYMNSSGYMVTGTQQIDGKTYHFSGSGAWIS